jgi:hypothetical protein
VGGGGWVVCLKHQRTRRALTPTASPPVPVSSTSSSTVVSWVLAASNASRVSTVPPAAVSAMRRSWCVGVGVVGGGRGAFRRRGGGGWVLVVTFTCVCCAPWRVEGKHA